jgi:hypothetical protein
VGLKSLPGTLTDDQARDALQLFLTAIARVPVHPVSIREASLNLRRTLGVEFGHDLMTGKMGNEILASTIRSWANLGKNDPVELLSMATQNVAAKLSDDQARDGLGLFFATINATADPYALRSLAEGLAALGVKPSASQAAIVAEPYLSAIKMANDPFALQALGIGLGAVPVILTDSQAKAAVEPFLAAIKRTTDPDALKALGEGIKALSAKLDRAAKKAAGSVLTNVVQRTQNSEVFAVYAELLVELSHYEHRDQQITRIFSLLRNPLAATELRNRSASGEKSPTKTLLNRLADVQGVGGIFHGLWEAVEWVQAEQKAGGLKYLELDASLQFQ